MTGTKTTNTKTKSTKPRLNPWPVAIIGYFIVFITAMAAWIVYASRQHMDLVRTDYYEKEILFQQQIDATSRARQMPGLKVAYNFEEQTITIQMPQANQQLNASGTVRLYRPDNARLDREVQLSLRADGTQRLDAKPLVPGLWKVCLSWRVSGQDYYFDQPVIIAGKS